jgi:hypothetical protein
LNVTLVERLGKRAYLTEAGEKLIEHARSLLDEDARTRSSICGFFSFAEIFGPISKSFNQSNQRAANSGGPFVFTSHEGDRNDDYDDCSCCGRDCGAGGCSVRGAMRG